MMDQNGLSSAHGSQTLRCKIHGTFSPPYNSFVATQKVLIEFSMHVSDPRQTESLNILHLSRIERASSPG